MVAFLQRYSSSCCKCTLLSSDASSQPRERCQHKCHHNLGCTKQQWFPDYRVPNSTSCEERHFVDHPKHVRWQQRVSSLNFQLYIRYVACDLSSSFTLTRRSYRCECSGKKQHWVRNLLESKHCRSNYSVDPKCAKFGSGSSFVDRDNSHDSDASDYWRLNRRIRSTLVQSPVQLGWQKPNLHHDCWRSPLQLNACYNSRRAFHKRSLPVQISCFEQVWVVHWIQSFTHCNHSNHPKHSQPSLLQHSEPTQRSNLVDSAVRWRQFNNFLLDHFPTKGWILQSRFNLLRRIPVVRSSQTVL